MTELGEEVIMQGRHYIVIGFIQEPSVILEDKSLGTRLTVAQASNLWRSKQPTSRSE